MKKLLFLLLSFCIGKLMIAQTNTFPSTGFVGIGTTSPMFQLDLVGNMQVSSGSIFLPNNGAMYGRDNGGTNRIIWLTGGDNSFAMATLGGGYNFYDRDLQHVLLHINEGGTVGIGTFATGPHKLAVEGSIGARKVVVEQTVWADYVFDKKYKLLTLPELAAYIEANKHLPELPTTNEVNKDGLDLGANQALLLKKIEELTLYILEQNRKMTAQEKQINEMKAAIEELREKFKTEPNIEATHSN